MSEETEKPKIARLPRPGEVIDGRYRLEGTFASGGMGVIMRAEQLITGREVAVKLLHAHIASRPDFAARFLREVKVATLFDHPHIVSVYDVGETDEGGLYLVMELLEGEELKDIIEREAPLSTGRVMELGLQMLDGLGEAHSQEVIHRDFKPANVFVTTTRRGKELVKLLDFGIAKLVNSGDMQVTATGSFTGTPSYMAPETMFDVTDVNKKAGDVYAAGLVLMEMLTGRRVFDGNVLAQTVLQHLKKPVLIPQAIAETPLGEVLQRATAKHPDDRYADGDEMFSALERARDETPEDICLSPREVPGPAPETSPSLLEKIGHQPAAESLAMLRDVPQAQAVGPNERHSSETGLSLPIDTPTGTPTTAEARSPSASAKADVDSTMELSDAHIDIVPVDDDGGGDTDDFDVGPTEVRAPELMPHRQDHDEDGSEVAKDTIDVDADFSEEPTRLDGPGGDRWDDDFEFEPTRVEAPSHLDNEHVPPGAVPADPDDETLKRTVDADSDDEALKTTVDADFVEDDESVVPTLEDSSGHQQPSWAKFVGVASFALAALIILAALVLVVIIGGDDEPSEDDAPSTSVAAESSQQEIEGEGEALDDEDAPEEEIVETDEEVEDEEVEDEEILIRVDIDSEPSGASVYADGEALGTTRLRLEFDESDRPTSFLLEKDGYEDETVDWLEDQEELTVTLDEIVEPERSHDPAPPQPAPAPEEPPLAEEEDDDDDTRDVDSVIDEHLFQ